jgi:hypothetical protein
MQIRGCPFAAAGDRAGVLQVLPAAVGVAAAEPKRRGAALVEPSDDELGARL